VPALFPRQGELVVTVLSVHGVNADSRVPFAVSKLAVRRKLRELGLESMLDTFLSANPTRQKDWDDSQILLTTDPLLVSSIPAFAAATGTTDAQIIDLLKSCRE